MDRLGLGYADVAAVAPCSVYVSVSGFGNHLPSPYKEWPAYAAMAESMAGFYERNRRNGERPRSGTACVLGDIGTALFASIGILAALRERDLTGKGQLVDVSMFDSMIAMADIVPFFWSMGLRQERGYAAPPVGIMDSFAVADGYVVIQVMREWHLKALAELVGRPDWVDDPRLAERRSWAERYEELLLPSLEAWGAHHTMVEATNALAAVGVAAAPSFGPEDLAATSTSAPTTCSSRSRVTTTATRCSCPATRSSSRPSTSRAGSTCPPRCRCSARTPTRCSPTSPASPPTSSRHSAPTE